MQVTHVSDHVTHAVIGAGDAHAFAINDSTEFFRILSSSLYSNKKLAVIREVLCNAWDAHIESGRTDTAVVVTITEDKLIIRDFGPGMSKANILKLYTTYGGTTKVANENVTGGFGLGSKSPFAYADHFETTSFFEGTATIYNMSLSSAEVDGKPSVMTIMDLPTTESGIQVSVNLKDCDDRYEFAKLVRQIAANGEMKVLLNDTKCKVIPFSNSPHGFTILNNELVGNSKSRVYVRYGHVIYPVDFISQLDVEHNYATSFLSELNPARHYGNGYVDWAVVLQAKPGSVSVTPSREALSMTDRTIESVRGMLNEFKGHTSEGLRTDCIQLTEQAIAYAIEKTKTPARLFSATKIKPGLEFFKTLKLTTTITTMPEAATHYMVNCEYPKFKGFQLTDMLLRLKELETRGFGDVGLIRSYRLLLERIGNPKHTDIRWLYRKLFWPLLRDLKTHPTMTAANLFVSDEGYDRSRFNRVLKQFPVMSYPGPQYLRDVIPFLRKVVVLSHNRTGIGDDAPITPIGKNIGTLKKTMAYIVPRRPDRIKEARAFFEQAGYEIIDLTPDQEIIREEKIKDDKPKAPPKPKRKGVPLLSNLLCGTEKQFINVKHGYREDAVLTETPAYAVIVSPNLTTTPSLHDFDTEATAAIVTLFGGEGAMVCNQAQLDKVVEKTKAQTDLVAYVLPLVVKEFRRNKLIQKYYRNYRAKELDLDWDTRTMLKIIRQDEPLRKAWKLPAPLPEREMLFVRIFESLHEYSFRNDENYKKLAAYRTKWTASPALKRLVGKIADNHFFERVLHLNQLGSSMKSTDPVVVDKARQIILLAMKG